MNEERTLKPTSNSEVGAEKLVSGHIELDNCLKAKAEAIISINKFYMMGKGLGMDEDEIETELILIIESGTNNEVGLTR